MSRTITAMFDTRADAEAAKQRLHDARVDADHVHVHDQSSQGYRGSGPYSSDEDRGVWDSIKNAFLPDEDRHTYEEGLRRGGVLLTADVDEHQVDEAVRVLEGTNSVDVDDRSQQWRSQGWDYGTAGTASGFTGDLASNRTGDEDFIGRDHRDDVEERSIPVVEERLQVGKREVERGGARVRSYVTETPVHEQIRLRNERIDVERRNVDRPLTDAEGDAFREQTIEMTARGEEAMVDKEARVVEEVVVRKTSDEKVRDIDDTVRRTEVEVDENASRRDRESTGSTGLFGSGTDRKTDY